MTLDRVIAELKKQYEYALKKPFIRRPLSYALYQTWKWVDKRERNRLNE